MINLRQLLEDFIEQFVELFQNLLIETKFRLTQKNLINLLMNITIDFRMFLNEILIFLQMLSPSEQFLNFFYFYLSLLNCGVEKTLESPLDCKEIKPVHPKGNQS